MVGLFSKKELDLFISGPIILMFDLKQKKIKKGLDCDCGLCNLRRLRRVFCWFIFKVFRGRAGSDVSKKSGR